MLLSGLVFVGWLFCSLVSAVLSGSEENVVTVCCLVRNPSGMLIGVATGVPDKMCLWVLGADT